MHQPARASQIEKAPPATLAATAHQPRVGSIPVATNTANPTPPETAKIPVRKRAALPAAPILHVSAMSNTLEIVVYEPMFTQWDAIPILGMAIEIETSRSLSE